MENIWKQIKRPIKVLAPMAGYTDSAFRILCREFGADLVITELISADAIAYGKFSVERKDGKVIVTGKNTATAEMLSFYEKERPLVVQLFGKYPEKFAKATKWITENLKPDGIDINMGCPARKVVGSDHGAALLKNHDLACKIVNAVKANTNVAVSVKTRLGWSDDDEILEFAPKLKEAGIDALIIHGRTYKDGFKGTARWKNIFKVKEMFGDGLVVIGNGDIKNGSQFSVVSPQSNIVLDGYAIGRATFGKPWIFSENAKIDLRDVILQHAELAEVSKGKKGIIELRKHLLAYLKGFPDAKELRLKAVRIECFDDVKNIVNELKAPELTPTH